MDAILTPSEVETLARANGRSVAQFCAQAGVAHTTFTRWRNGTSEPRLAVYRRIVAAAAAPPDQIACEAA